MSHPAFDAEQQLFSDQLMLALAAREGLATLERAELDAALKELALAAIFEADDPADRLDAARLLDVQFLVTLRTSPTRDEAVRVDLIETRLGLRVMQTHIVVDGELMDATEALSRLLAEQIASIPEQFDLLVAVPRFVDARLVQTDDGLADALPELVRQQLHALPGAMEITLEDAEAIQRELAMRGKDRLGLAAEPVILTGTLRSGAGMQQTVVQMTLVRGGEPVATGERRIAKAGSLSSFVRHVSQTMLGELIDDRAQQQQPIAREEAKRLLDQAELFAQVGDSEQMVHMASTALLLAPEMLQARAVLIRGWASQLSKARAKVEREVAGHQADQIELYRRIMEQLLHIEFETRLALPGERQPRPILSDYLTIQYWPNRFVSEEVFKIRRAVRDRLIDRLTHLAERGSVRASILRAGGALFNTDEFYGETAEETFEWRWDLFETLRTRIAPEALMRPLFNLHYKVTNEGPVLADRLDEKVDDLPPRAALAVHTLAARLRLGAATGPGQPELVEPPNAVANENPAREDVAEASEPDAEDALSPPQLEQLNLPVHTRNAHGVREAAPIGWIDVAPYGELLWQNRELFLLDDQGALHSLVALSKALYEAEGHNKWTRGLSTPAFDGRYVWTALPRAEPLLIVVDLETKAVAMFDSASDLPPMTDGVSIAAIKPSEVIITGSFGFAEKNRRSWSAKVSLDPAFDAISLNVFRQATSRRKADRGTGLMGFATGDSIVLENPEDPTQRVVLVHQLTDPRIPDPYSRLWLMVDPATLEYRVLPWKDMANRKAADLLVTRDRIYWKMHTYSTQDTSYEVLSWGWPDLELRRERPDWGGGYYSGSIVYEGMHLGVNSGWGMDLWAAPQPGQPMRQITAKLEPSDVEGVEDFHHARLVHSRRHGLVLLDRAQQAWRVTLPDDAWEHVHDPVPPPNKAVQFGNHLYMPVHRKRSFERAQQLARWYGAEIAPADEPGKIAQLQRLPEDRYQQASFWLALWLKDGQLERLDGTPTELEGYTPPRGLDRRMIMSHNGVGPAEPEREYGMFLRWPAPPTNESDDLEGSPEHPGPDWLDLVELPAGQFVMGSPPDEPGAKPYEPQREVEIGPGLWMSAVPITQSQWHRVMHGREQVGDRPMQVSLPKAARFCHRLSQLTGQTYRLPTEAEWEYAARAGSTTAYATGNTVDDLRSIGWASFDGEYGSAEGPARPRALAPNAWGLYAMHGNYAEWTASYLPDDTSTIESEDHLDMQRLRRRSDTQQFVVRGGTWYDRPEDVRAASRRLSHDFLIVFRVVLDTNASP